MTRSLVAGAVYFVIVFAAAFALGVLRVTFVVPAIGNVWATLVELPFTLSASWVTCAWAKRHWRISSIRQSSAMGASAFVLLMGAEFAGAVAIFDRTISEHFGLYGTVAGALGLAGQIAFGLFPVIQGLRRNAALGR
ncbi:MAG: hypothetical protein ABUS57_05410 [Pseudomonadota bacterium]